MSGLITRKHHRVNIMINDRFVRFVETGKNKTIIKYGQKVIPSGLVKNGVIDSNEEFPSFLSQFVKESKIQRRIARFCVPDSHVILRQTNVPLEVPDSEIKGHLYFQLGQSLHLPFEDPIIEAVPKGVNNGEKEVLLVATKESTVQQYKKMLASSKLHAEAADLSCLSIYRLYYHLDLARPQEHLLIVHADSDSLVLSVFHDHKPVIIRQVQLDLPEEAIEVHQNGKYMDQLLWKGTSHQLHEMTSTVLDEVNRMMNVYRSNLAKGQYEVNKILVVGDHPCLPQFVAELNGQLAQAIESFIEPLFQTKKNVNVPALFSDCIGLGLK
ncbi:hypothetical protein GCM10008967_25920 [Bacillus carboniphilus]|uniref:Pilus assembly protein PilM n=1 Tax=Bacillus carboniphilus TaxID=86663 RepID=A0ABN0WDR0_9BACI